MLFVVEKYMFQANDQMHFVDELKRSGRKHLLVDFIPFEHTIVPMPKDPHHVIAFGSVNMVESLIKHAETQQWVYFNENFRVDEWLNAWQEHMLNWDGYTTLFKNIQFRGTKFIRPVNDLKAFAGTVVHEDKLAEWKESAIRYSAATGSTDVLEDTPVFVSSVKDIEAEYRLFVVDSRIVTGSRYRHHGVLDYTTDVPSEVTEFAQRMVDIWSPARGFVLDVAKTSNGYKIIEVNCMNSAGLYACDVAKIIASL